MKKFLAPVLLVLASAAHAQQTQTSVQNQIDTNITTNGANQITGAKLNSVLTTINQAVFQPLSGAPAAVTITPPTGLNQAINATLNGSGTIVAPFDFTQYKVFTDHIAAGALVVTGFNVDHYFANGDTSSGPTSGGRAAIQGNLFLAGTTNSANPNRDYTAVGGQAQALFSDGGTSPSASSTTKGALFGAGFVAVLANGATAFTNITGAEFNTAAQTGSSVWAKSLAQFSGRTDDAVAGSGINAMGWFYNQSGAVKWSDGILFDNAGALGDWPISTSGTILRTAGGGTVTNGIDLSDTTFTGSAFKSSGFAVGPTGAVFVGSGAFAANTAQLYTQATYGLVVTAKVGGTYDFSVFNPAGNPIMEVPTGNTNVTFGNGITVTGSVTGASYHVGATAGVDCPSGVTAGTVVVVKGIVTHC